MGKKRLDIMGRENGMSDRYKETDGCLQKGKRLWPS